MYKILQNSAHGCILRTCVAMSPNPLFLRKTVAEKMLMVEGDSMVKFEALALLLIKGFS